MNLPSLFVAMLALSSLPLTADEVKPAAAAVIKEVTPMEAEKLLKENPKIVVLDVRTPEEFARGHIPGAKNVDFLTGDVAKQAPALDSQTPILVHCAAGGRSTQTLDLLKDKQVIYHLKEGFKGWEKAGKPVER